MRRPTAESRRRCRFPGGADFTTVTDASTEVGHTCREHILLGWVERGSVAMSFVSPTHGWCSVPSQERPPNQGACLRPPTTDQRGRRSGAHRLQDCCSSAIRATEGARRCPSSA